MIIRKIEVRNFRKLVNPVVISGLGPGVNIIAGDNEEGKSTLLTALRCAFFLKHTTTGQAVEHLLPYGSAVRPEISVEFDLLDGSYHLHKTFCAKPFTARLRSPFGVVEGAAVEEKLQELLMYPASQTGKKAADADRGFWGLLWLEQAAAIGGLSMTEYGRQTLVKAVESDIGTVLGGKNGRALMSAVTRLYGDHFTPAKGDPTKEYRKHKETLEQLIAELDSLRLASRDYERKVDDLTAKRDQMAGLKRDNAMAMASKRLEVARLEADKFKKALSDFDLISREEKTLRAECASLKHQWETRTQLRMDLDRCNRDRQNAEKMRDQTQIDLVTLLEQLAASQAHLEQIQQEEKDCQETIARLQIAEKYQKLKVSSNELARKLARAKEVHSKFEVLFNEHKKFKVDEKNLQTLRTLHRAVHDAESKAAAASTRIVVFPNIGHSAQVLGEELGKGETLLISESTVLELSDWGNVEVHPGGEDLAAKRQEALRLRNKLQAEFASLGVGSIDEAEEQLQRKLQTKSEAEVASSELRLLVPSGMRALETELAQVEKELSSICQPVAVETDLAEELKRLSLKLDSLRKQDVAEQKTNREITGRVHRIELSAGEFNGRINSLAKQAEDVAQRLEKLSAEEPDEALKQRYEDALHKCSVKERETAAAKTHVESFSSLKIKDELEAAERALKQIQALWENLEHNIELLAVEVETLARQGPGERLSECEGRVDKARQQFENIDRKARSIKLLYETMKQCEEQAKQQFMQPVQLRLRPYLNAVFPNTDVSLDQAQFEIRGLTRNSQLESYEMLSVGTREQISVLTRLAIAGLLKEKGYPAAVILDDALVYSDEHRFNLMKDVLQKAAEQHSMQVLILTCRKRDYIDMEAAVLVELSNCICQPA